MLQVLMIIIACGTGNGTGCAIHSLYVTPQTCKNAQDTIKNPWYATAYVYCITNRIPE